MMDERHSLSAPNRLMMLGSAGTGKSRTLRAIVGSKRRVVREAMEGELLRARSSVAARGRGRRDAGSAPRGVGAPDEVGRIAELLGVASEEVRAVVEARAQGEAAAARGGRRSDG